MFAACAVIPVYDHEHAVARVLEAVRGAGLPCILVDDGSHEACAAELRRLAQRADVSLVRLAVNQGKGGAVQAGLAAAAAAGYSHVLQIDADGQHAFADIPRFIARARAQPDAIICGRPVFDASMPRSRRVFRHLSHALVWLQTWSFGIRDSMCGFRVYPLDPMTELLRTQRLGLRMDFDIEVLVHLHWRGVAFVWIDTPVCYPLDGVSHFRLLRDNIGITRLHLRLLLGMLRRMPQLARRTLHGGARGPADA